MFICHIWTYLWRCRRWQVHCHWRWRRKWCSYESYQIFGGGWLWGFAIIESRTLESWLFQVRKRQRWHSKFIIVKVALQSWNNFQVLLAIGGLYYNGNWIYLDTTEMFDYTDWTTTSSSKWRAASPLPTPIYGHQAVALANSVFVFGKNHQIVNINQ